MRLGLALPHYDTSLSGRPVSWDSVVRVARLAEQAGFDSLWVSDHMFLDWGKYGGPSEPQGSLECWSTISALAASTIDVRLGSLTLCNDLRNPGLLAKMIATTDLLSGGRIDVGLGAGWYEPEYRALGISFDSAADRIRRLGEAVGIVTRLLSGETVDMDGRYYTMQAAVCRPAPAQQPRPAVWIGGKGDLLLQTAARVADGWNLSWVTDVDAYRGRSKVADEACETAGREPADLRRSVGAYVLLGRDERDLRRRFDRAAERTPSGVLKRQGIASVEDLSEAGIAATPARFSDKLRELAELGVEEVILTLGVVPFQLVDEEDVEFAAAELSPMLQAL